MSARLTDSPAYAHLWGTDETRALFDESARWQRWLDILTALGHGAGRTGNDPDVVGQVDRRLARVEALDFDFLAEETQRVPPIRPSG